MSICAIGADLGGTSLKAALVRRSAGIIATVRMDTGADHGPSHVLGQICHAVRALLAERPQADVRGIGLGAPGTVDLARQTLIHPPNIRSWGRIDVRAALRERLGTSWPVVVENDANAAALGSAHYGAGRPHASFIMVTLGTGVGGAIIMDKEVFRGTTGAAGEIGHMTINFAGPIDRAGVAGAIEAYIGQRYLTEHARNHVQAEGSPLLRRMAGSDLAALAPAMLSEAAIQGDAAATAILRWAGHKLGCVLGACINLLDIRVVVIGGGVSGAGEHILEPARQAVLEFVKPGMREGVTILQETLGNEAGMLGAAHLVFDHADSHGSTSGDI